MLNCMIMSRKPFCYVFFFQHLFFLLTPIFLLPSSTFLFTYHSSFLCEMRSYLKFFCPCLMAFHSINYAQNLQRRWRGSQIKKVLCSLSFVIGCKKEYKLQRINLLRRNLIKPKSFGLNVTSRIPILLHTASLESLTLLI